MGQKQLCQLPSIHSSQKKFALNFFTNLILKQEDYSSLPPDFNKVSWLSLFKTTKKVKILFHPPRPD